MIRCPIIDRDGVERCACNADDILGLLANARRRAVVSVLETTDDDWIGFDRLVAALSAETADVSAETWRIELHHVHLPMLEELGVIEYDGHAGTIRYYRCELLVDVLTAVEATRDRR
ncbi:hypothetical protein SAMN04489841_4734 [Natrinema salaciae]|uniref:DUF7344 domain-containing protein n=2 Tax=Natrinema salaciae TaxID=1186196 RepID=A0A1H9SNH5_9EURY|nr:hypothetical protein SAMN04489841_4734 [Natrinema salaciae]